MSHDDYVDAGTALRGTKIADLPEDVRHVEFAYVVAKVLYESGEISWVYRTSVDPNKYELLGVLRLHQQLLEKELMEDWEPEEPD